jgi:hypothetical protein
MSKRLMIIVILGVSTLFADTLRDKTTGAIVEQKGKGKVVDGKTIEWTRCDGSKKRTYDASKFDITKNDNCPQTNPSEQSAPK